MSDARALDIRPLSPDGWDDLARLFGEGGDPRFCWCMYWRLRSSAFSNNRIADNRDALRSLAERAATEGGPAPGLVAYRAGQAVGWVGLGPRATFERLERSRTIPRLDERPVWSIVCFAVSASARGEGVARALLDAAVRYAQANGAPAIEAYPAAVKGARMPANALYTGDLAWFEAAGFRTVGETSSHTAGVSRVVVRRELGRSDASPA